MKFSKDLLGFLESLRRDNLKLSLDGEDLVVSGPLSEDAAEEIRARKPEILAFLRAVARGEGEERTLLTPDTARRFEPFPLNETQQAYWLGRDSVFESGEVAIHVFVEMADPALDLERAEAAWKRLYGHHDMLRAVVLPDGQQQVLAAPPDWHLPIDDLRDLAEDQARERLAARREEMSHHCADLGRWPTWLLQGVRLPDGKNALLLSLDCWTIDGRSVQIVAADFAALYADPEARLPETDLTFRDYVLGLEAEQETEAYAQALDYWRRRITALPPAPQIPRREREAEGRPRFLRHAHRIPATVHRALKDAAVSRGLTLANVLIGCYAETLGRWSGTSHFTLNVPRWNRHALHPDVDEIVGEFATFELLEVDLGAGGSFLERVKGLQRQFAEDLNHDVVSGVRILREWRKHSGAGPGVAIPYVFTHEPDLFGEGRTRAWMASFNRIAPVTESLTQTPQVWIDAQYHDVDGELLLVWDALDDLFPEGLIDEMFQAYAGLAERLGRDATTWEEASPLRLPAAQAKLREEVNDTDSEVSLPGFLDCLQRQAETRPEAVAIVDRQGSIDWLGLQRRVAALAQRLARSGADKGTPVAAVMDKGAEQVIAALALHRLGAVCVPLDPASPRDRLRYMLEHCKAPLILTTAGLADGLAWPERRADQKLLVVDRDARPKSADLPPARALADDDLHCILYTSGSTGQPKGVKVPLGGLVNVVDDGLARFDVTAESCFLSLSPFHHDLALFDIYASLAAGARLVLPDPERRRDPGHWLGLMKEQGVTAWNSVPAMMVMLLDYCEGRQTEAEAIRRSLRSLRCVILGGDWIPVETPRRLRAWAANAALSSVGGPTETTVWNISYRAEEQPEGWPSIPYGRPTNNNRYYVLDDRLEDCPDWTAGELCCAGTGVTLGYLDDEERTREAFVTHPRTGERMYRTGDRGRYRPDGLIEFLGRQDNQINLNGYRMELGEIETCLSRHPAVAQAVAVPRREGRTVRSVFAWATLLPGRDTGEAELLDFAKAALPRQMHPAALRIRDAFPLTANGKVHRLKLTEEAEETLDSGESFDPADDIEALVTEAWQKVLGSPPPSRDTSFFAAGGDSITAIQLYNALLADRVEGATVLTVFRSPSVAALAAVIAEAAGPAQPALPEVLPTARDSAAYPATAAQTRLWLEERLAGTGALYNLCFNLSLEGEIEATAIESALAAIVASWESLRTALQEQEDGTPVQVLLPAWKPRLTVTDAQAGGNPDECLAQIGAEEAETPFVLSDGRPLRAHLVLMASRRAQLIVTLHHTACDGWSFNLFAEALAKALDGGALDAPACAPIDYARWESRPDVSAEFERQIAWWKDRLEGLPGGTKIDLGRGRPDLRAARAALEARRLPPELGRRIGQLAQQHDATPYVVLLTALALVLRRLTAEPRVVIGSHVALRDRPGLDQMPGMLVNNLVLDMDFAALSRFDEALALGRSVFLESWDRGLAPFNRVVQALGGWPDATRHPLYGITFTHESIAGGSLRGGGLRISHGRPFVARTALDLDLAMAEAPDGAIVLKALYNAAVLEPSLVTGLLVALESFVAKACDEPSVEVSALPWCGESAAALLRPGQGPAEAFDLSLSPAELFRRQVEGTPEAVALLDAQGAPLLSFTALDRLVGRATAAFVEKGLRPGGTAAILLPRDPDLVAAMLAVWRCGAHFVALSPDQPAERVAQILEDAAPQVIACRPGAVALPPGAVQSDPAEWQDFAPWEEALSQDDDVIVLLFTSGSTGRPNGVEFTRRALINRLLWQWKTLPYGEAERCVARAAVDFGDYLTEIFGPLLAGRPLALLDAETARDPRRLAAAVKAVGAERLLTVPSLLDLLLEDASGVMPAMEAVRLWSVSGEPLPLAVLRRFFAARPSARLLNLYGSSESGADVTFGEQRLDTEIVAVGKPLPNIGVHIVDDALTPLPEGIPGQLLITGEGLARGYRKRPELTASRFISWRGQRAFLSGDRGLRRADGEIVLLRRLDRQVKVRGQRIELDEVQVALAAVRGVEAAAVAFDSDGEAPGIVALVTGGARPLDILARARSRLPEAALPSRIALVDQLPRTAGGKLAFHAVPGLVRDAREDDEGSDGEPPATEKELALAELWQEVLGQQPASRHDRFNDLGGHSIAAARLTARIRKSFGIEFPLRWILERGALADMAEAIEELQGAAFSGSAAAGLEEFVL